MRLPRLARSDDVNSDANHLGYTAAHHRMSQLILS
jgi:hypothetical protein